MEQDTQDAPPWLRECFDRLGLPVGGEIKSFSIQLNATDVVSWKQGEPWPACPWAQVSAGRLSVVYTPE